MDNSIYQTVLDSILSLDIPEWDKIIFYAQYDKDSYEMTFYVERDGTYEDCFSLGIPEDSIDSAFVQLDKEVCKARGQLQAEKHPLWSVMTIIFEPTMHFKSEFDYSETEDTIAYKSEWGKKYLI